MSLLLTQDHSELKKALSISNNIDVFWQPQRVIIYSKLNWFRVESTRIKKKNRIEGERPLQRQKKPHTKILDF